VVRHLGDLCGDRALVVRFGGARSAAPAPFNSVARSFIAAGSSSVNPLVRLGACALALGRPLRVVHSRLSLPALIALILMLGSRRRNTFSKPARF